MVRVTTPRLICILALSLPLPSLLNCPMCVVARRKITSMLIKHVSYVDGILIGQMHLTNEIYWCNAWQELLTTGQRVSHAERNWSNPKGLVQNRNKYGNESLTSEPEGSVHQMPINPCALLQRITALLYCHGTKPPDSGGTRALSSS